MDGIPIRTYRSLTVQFIQWDKSDKIILDADVLTAFSINFNRSFNVNCLHQFPQCVGGQFPQIRVFPHLSDKRLQIDLILRLLLNFPLQVFCLRLHQPLLHNRPEVGLMTGDAGNNHLDMCPNQFLQHHGPDKMRTALFAVHTVSRADEIILAALKTLAGVKIEPLPAVCTEYKPGEHTAPSCFCHAVTLLAEFLYLIEHFLLNDGFMGPIEHRLFLRWIFPRFLI